MGRKTTITRRLVDGRDEMLLLTGLVWQDSFGKRLCSGVRDLHELLSTPSGRCVAEAATKFLSRYGKAAGAEIEHLVQSAVENLPDPTQQAAKLLVEQVMEKGSEPFNAEHALDRAEIFLRERSAENLTAEVRSSLVGGDVEAAERAISRYNRPTVAGSSGVCPLDREIIRDALDDERKDRGLFSFSGALGRMMNIHLEREGLIGFLGPEKRGKTFVLAECAIRAALARNNVLIFEAGDMSQRQIVRRMQIRLAGRSDLPRYCEELDVPVLDCLRNQDDSCRKGIRTGRAGLVAPEDTSTTQLWDQYCSGKCARHRACSECEARGLKAFRGSVWWKRREPVQPLTWREAVKISKRFQSRTRNRHFVLHTYPNDTLTVEMMDAVIDSHYARDGWVPDVMILDYADICAADEQDERGRQNLIWKGLRRLTQKYHLLGITATQAAARAYDKQHIGMKDFSEDKRKFAHATGIVGLNQTEEEKMAGVMRWGWVVLREGEFYATQEVTVLGRPQMGSLCLSSFR